MILYVFQVIDSECETEDLPNYGESNERLWLNKGKSINGHFHFYTAFMEVLLGVFGINTAIYKYIF